MAKKKDVYHVQPLNENKRNIIQALIDEYDIKTTDDIQDALKDLLGGTIKSMMDAEMDSPDFVKLLRPPSRKQNISAALSIRYETR